VVVALGCKYQVQMQVALEDTVFFGFDSPYRALMGHRFV
tara:strand:- start:217 stop:333 length:117 start_codon:yes stop_codon:yes gene_type:complete